MKARIIALSAILAGFTLSAQQTSSAEERFKRLDQSRSQIAPFGRAVGHVAPAEHSRDRAKNRQRAVERSSSKSINLQGAANNILLIILDDYGVDSSPLYNTNAAAVFPPTPNLTTLAQSGVIFQNAYVQPVCSPTRACLLTGRYGFRTGVGQVFGLTGGTPLAASEFTLPEAFAANASLGYQCAQFGKWHLAAGQSSPNIVGAWPLFKGPIMGAIPDYSNWQKVTCGTGVTTVQEAITNYAPTEMVNDALAWIAQRDAAGQPWFAWVALNPPHTPLHKPPNDLHSYDWLPGTTQHINNYPRLYWHAMMEAVDTEIGRLLAGVDRAKTHVIFLGDNGTTSDVIQPPYVAERAKGTLYEGGIKVPMFISGPAVPNPGRTNTALVQAVDLFPTILELCGINVAATVPATTTIDGRSLLPLLRNETETTPRYAYADLFGDSIASTDAGKALRNTQYKLIRFQSGTEAFYDLLADPAENSPLDLAGLTDVQRANYYSLVLRLARYQDTLTTPVITASGLDPSAGFSITVARNPALTYTLWRSTILQELSWAPVTGTTTTTTDTTVTLTDPSPPADRAFYKVLGQ
ncbi:MAG: hypothetical protein FJ395_03940 [Verrucomicrobia bacterium]|nr:hypothetical protein [Verrucomicrobiota bacterium]